MQYQKRTILLRAELQRQNAIAELNRIKLDDERPIRIVFDCPLPSKSRAQEAVYHIMIGDIAAQYQHCGKFWSAEDMKRILIDQFKRDTINDSDFRDMWASMGITEMAPSFDGSGVVMLGVQSRNFPYSLAKVFITWLEALGSELNVTWTERKEPQR